MSDSLTPELLARYADARIPRYTSYPTAPHFSPDVGEGDYREWLTAMPADPVSLYLHIPFCRRMCWYCGCHTTVAAREEPVARYLDALTREIALVRSHLPRRQRVTHIHFGGGTPTLISPEQMRGLMEQLSSAFELAPNAEVAVEIDPRTLRADMVEALAGCGFNRASIGVQSFDPAVQQAINRVQSFECTKDAVERLRASGIHRLNFDLIYGLPRQTVRSCRDTVAQCLALGPDRLAVFGYAHVPAFKPHQRKIDGTSLPDSEGRFAQSRAIADALVEAGYVAIGLDHFALPGDPLAIAAQSGTLRRNFQGYTTDEAGSLIGLGASSIGRLGQGFVQNAVGLPAYQRTVAEGRLPIVRGYRLSDEDRLRGAVIERLMCDQRVDLAEACRPFGADPARLRNTPSLKRLAGDGLVTLDGDRVTIARHAGPLVRTIAAAFDAHLQSAQDRHSRAV